MDWGPLPSPRVEKRARSWFAALLGGGMVAVAAGVAVWVFHNRRPLAVTTEPPPPADTAPAELEAAFAMARRALTSQSWESALPLIRHAGRVEPLMRRYHAAHPWTPVVLTNSRDGRLSARADRPWAILSCNTERGRVIDVHAEYTPSGWKLDWEALTNAPSFEWDEFIAQAPAESRRLRVSALLGSVPDEYFSKAGLDPERTLAVRLFGTEPSDSVVALVPNGSELGRLLRLELTWEIPRAYVCDLRFANPSTVPPRAEVTTFVQKGWDLGEETH